MDDPADFHSALEYARVLIENGYVDNNIDLFSLAKVVQQSRRNNSPREYNDVRYTSNN